MLTVLAVGLMLVLVMLAARVGPQRIVNGPLVDPSIHPVTPSYSFPTIAPFRTGSGGGGVHTSRLLLLAGWAIRVLFAVCLLWLLYVVARRLAQVVVRPRRPAPRPEPVEFDVLEDPERLAGEIRDDYDAQLALLLGGEPRNAIVACWDRFEQQAERVGVARRAWETSSEFAIRILDAVRADAGAVARLERLYHEARFSEHEIGEPQRSTAVTALEEIHASLQARVLR